MLPWIVVMEVLVRGFVRGGRLWVVGCGLWRRDPPHQGFEVGMGCYGWFRSLFGSVLAIGFAARGTGRAAGGLDSNLGAAFINLNSRGSRRITTPPRSYYIGRKRTQLAE